MQAVSIPRLRGKGAKSLVLHDAIFDMCKKGTYNQTNVDEADMNTVLWIQKESG